MTPRRRRLAAVLIVLGLLATAAALLLGALRHNLDFFLGPGELLQQRPAPQQRLRLGGVVEPGSLRREPGSMTVHFVVAEGAHRVPVRYSGLLPDLFGEGQGVVAGGRLGRDGVFDAHEVLAKHDENYMPPTGESRPAWVKP
ncbi:cytochrome c maturation protein CcmE [Azohydromonas caseinilytica]|uniref:Cytochrome c-type biogenesis protein CcmE n=1 Tax=Azohydromonas caseinilytica TaxID=2728836 RepID=A0A848FG35_9BURK|nr:cytochrome c maturation protein CcmE [Azohydromonas caseinilytica]NML18408.1 cytochrome c maturation protein CcmE [Azohydromonas caseinilytica]